MGTAHESIVDPAADRGPVVPVPPQTVLLNPGPVNVAPEVRAALAYPDVCHREPEVALLMQAVRQKLVMVAGGGAEHRTVLLTGSGTAALEAAVASTVPLNSRLAILSNGHYGHRLQEIAEAHGVPHTVLESPWERGLEIAELEALLRDDPSVTHIAMVHHETSTGMLNDVAAVGDIVRRHGRSLMVDAISSLGSERLDIVADGIDWLIGTANKCIEGVPGTSFVIAPERRLRELAQVRQRAYYLSLRRHFLAQEDLGAPAFTPAVQTLYALDAAVDLLLKETVDRRRRRYETHAAIIRAGLEALGLRPYLPDQPRANSVTHYQLPAGVTYAALHDGLKQRGFVIYATQIELGPVFRVANMGQVTAEQLHRFVQVFAETLEELTSA